MYSRNLQGGHRERAPRRAPFRTAESGSGTPAAQGALCPTWTLRLQLLMAHLWGAPSRCGEPWRSSSPDAEVLRPLPDDETFERPCGALERRGEAPQASQTGDVLRGAVDDVFLGRSRGRPGERLRGEMMGRSAAACFCTAHRDEERQRRDHALGGSVAPHEREAQAHPPPLLAHATRRTERLRGRRSWAGWSAHAADIHTSAVATLCSASVRTARSGQRLPEQIFWRILKISKRISSGSAACRGESPLSLRRCQQTDRVTRVWDAQSQTLLLSPSSWGCAEVDANCTTGCCSAWRPPRQANIVVCFSALRNASLPLRPHKCTAPRAGLSLFTKRWIWDARAMCGRHR